MRPSHSSVSLDKAAATRSAIRWKPLASLCSQINCLDFGLGEIIPSNNSFTVLQSKPQITSNKTFIYCNPRGAHDLDDVTSRWKLDSCPNIKSGSTSQQTIKLKLRRKTTVIPDSSLENNAFHL
ncbi:unnamed protein product [Clavelina lepadiformis]|uniref:Uncharacterized protein n=1 Tax=Clavelina lepadiformis TaxID=159417 RepID=A0ABP0F4A6_CLALP